METFLLEGQIRTSKYHLQLVKTNGVHTKKYNDKKITEKCGEVVRFCFNSILALLFIVRFKRNDSTKSLNEPLHVTERHGTSLNVPYWITK